MTKTLIALAILALIIYYQQKKETKPALNESENNSNHQELTKIKQANQTLMAFLRSDLNSNSLERSPDNLSKLLEELKTKLAGKTLDEILEENSDYETEVDTLTRTKNSLEQDLTAQSNAFQSRIREKDRELKKAKQDLQ